MSRRAQWKHNSQQKFPQKHAWVSYFLIKTHTKPCLHLPWVCFWLSFLLVFTQSPLLTKFTASQSEASTATFSLFVSWFDLARQLSTREKDETFTWIRLFYWIIRFQLFCFDGKALLMAQMVKNLPAMQETRVQSWDGEIPWRREWQSIPVFLPGKFHGQRSLGGYRPWGHKASDTAGRLTLTQVTGEWDKMRWPFSCKRSSRSRIQQSQLLRTPFSLEDETQPPYRRCPYSTLFGWT